MLDEFLVFHRESRRRVVVSTEQKGLVLVFPKRDARQRTKKARASLDCESPRVKDFTSKSVRRVGLLVSGDHTRLNHTIHAAAAAGCVQPHDKRIVAYRSHGHMSVYSSCTGLYFDFCLCSRGTIPSSLAVSTFSDPVVMFSGSGQTCRHSDRSCALIPGTPVSLPHGVARRSHRRMVILGESLTPPALDLAIDLPPLFLRRSSQRVRGASF